MSKVKLEFRNYKFELFVINKLRSSITDVLETVFIFVILSKIIPKFNIKFNA